MTFEKYDFGVVGAGGAGLAGAMYGARLGLKTVIFGASNANELPIGGLITTAHAVRNYPGILSASGLGIAKKIEEHARDYDLVTIKQEKVLKIEKKKDCFEIKTTKGNYKISAVLLATGRRIRKLDVPGSMKLEGRGVSYCALCDAPLYKDKVVAVVGGSDSAAIESLVLSEYAKKVYIIYRGKAITPEEIHLKEIKMNKKIEIITNTNVVEIKGKDYVESIILDKEYNGKKELKLDGIYAAIGNIPISELAKELGVKLNKNQEIVLDHATSGTSVAGVFAAGDVTNKSFKQLIIGVAEACTAAHSAFEYVSEMKMKQCEK
jgi:thioredoxin reductase (NADPH)